jgi:tRNA(His) guanylyltransferase
MSDRTALGDRMKQYEHTTRVIAPRRMYSLMRVDIRAAHSYLRHAQRPFDHGFITDMDAVAEALCKEVMGAVFAFTQSDEISLLFHDFASTGTQPWFGGVMAKQLSISAALASATLSRLRPDDPPVMFDSRVWHMADPVEVANYFVWRQRDAIRNSIQMVAQSNFSHRELQGLNTDQLQEKLWAEKQINWNDFPDELKRGRIARKRTSTNPVLTREWLSENRNNPTAVPPGHAYAMRESTYWATDAAPDFTAQPDGFLAAAIPPMPSF